MARPRCHIGPSPRCPCNVIGSVCLLCCEMLETLPLSKLGFNYNFQPFETRSVCARAYKRTWDTRGHHDHKVWLFIYTYRSQSTCRPLCSDAELILRDWKYWFDSVSYFVVENEGRGGGCGGAAAPSWLLAPCSHIGLATQPVPRETHNYSRPFRLVQQPVQLCFTPLVIYSIPSLLLRGAPRHNDTAGLCSNVCDDKHSGF